MATHKPQFPVVVTSNDNFEIALGVKAVPTAAVMDTQGNLAYTDGLGRGSAKSILAEQLKKADGPLIPKALTKVQTAHSRGGVAEAFVALEKAKSGKLDQEALAWVDRYETALEQSIEDTLRSAQTNVDTGLIFLAIEALEPLADSKLEFPGKQEISTLFGELQETPELANEIKAAKYYKLALESIRSREYADSVKSLKKVYTKYEGTKLSEVARQKAVELVESGMPGYRSGCTTCRQARSACEKHTESIKL